MTRRELLGYAALLAPTLNLPIAADEGSGIDAVLARIKAPVFANRDFDITKYGAKSDGRTKCTDAIRSAIHACHAEGGGRVVVPQGTFFTGAVHLESNVNLYVSEGATLLFSTDPRDYLPLVYTRFESTECMNYSPLIYAFEKENVGLSGPGTLDGQADATHWWDWTKKARAGKTRDDKQSGPNDVQTLVEEMGNKDVPVKERLFGLGHYLRPNFIQPYRCKNVLLEGFTVKRSPMWELNPTLCQNVTVRGVNIDCPNGPNNDGCDPDACADVLIEKCTFSTGDDCIALKSGRNRDGRRVGVPTSNVIIQDCVMKDGHGGVSIGSEVSGGMKNIWVRRCEMSSPHLQRALRIKTNSYRGGDIENIWFTNVNVGQVADDVVQVTFYYEEGPGGPFKPTVKNIFVADVVCDKSQYGLNLQGYPDDPISGVTLSNCTFNNASKENNFQNVEGVKVSNVKVNGKLVTAAEMQANKR
ncbi:MAG TPA: glycoside hydrolase family 28 protein [Bryobacteraceae bacterium]|nr:glycoside hydrolase family 28 protein [Bryobacteraceae bacterium]